MPTILSAATRVDEWNTLLTAQKTSDFFVEQMMSNQQSGQINNMPSPAAIYDAGVEVRSSINRTFAGDGIRRALAILNEYLELVDILNDADLPAAVGLVNKDAVLMKLGFDANHATIRSEAYITSFVLSLIDAKTLSEGHELQFFRQLNALNKQIDWSALTGNSEDAVRFSTTPTMLGMGIPFGSTVGSGHPQISATVQNGLPQLQQMNGHTIEVHEA